MSLKLGDVVPNFSAPVSPDGRVIDFHTEIGDGWAVLFSHPDDFTPVCTTELGTVAKYHSKFTDRGVKVFALSCNDVASHAKWIKDIEAAGWNAGKTVEYPIIADPKREIATAYGMLDPDERDAAGVPMTCRAVFVVHQKALKLALLYPATTGRNFDEIIRAIDSLQLTANHKVATPVNWRSGDKCMVTPNTSDADALKAFGSYTTVSVPSAAERKREYIRMVADPSRPFTPLDRAARALQPAALLLAGLAAGVALTLFAKDAPRRR